MYKLVIALFLIFTVNASKIKNLDRIVFGENYNMKIQHFNVYKYGISLYKY